MTQSFKRATDVIKKFGGIRPMAQKLKVPVTTVQGWKKRNAIPDNRVNDILAAAKNHNIDLKSLIASNSNEAATTPAAATTKKAEAPTPASKPATKTAEAPKSQATPKSEKALPSFEKVYEGKDALAYADSLHQKNVKQSLIGGAALIVALIAAGLALFSPASAPKQDTAAFEAAIAKMEAQIEQNAKTLNEQDTLIQQRLDQLAQSQQDNETPLLTELKSIQADLAENQDLQNAYDRLNTAVTALGQSVVSIQDRWGDMQRQVENANVTTADLRAATMLIALSYIRSSLDRSEPFMADYALMQKWFGTDNDPDLRAALNRLAPYASTGILSSDGLAKELESLSNEVINAGLSGDNAALEDKIQSYLNRLVKVTKDGTPVTGSPTDKKLQEAQIMLSNDRIAAAIATLRGLDPQSRAALEPWFRKAQGTLAAKNLETLLSSKLLGLSNQDAQLITR